MDKTFSLFSHSLRALMLATTAALAACGGGGSDAPPSNPPPSVPQMNAADACVAMLDTKVAASQIAFPTTGATVTATSLQAASGTGTSAVGEYCRVQGVISPVDPTAPGINFQVNLPTSWNGKTIQLMGGGYDGSVVTGTGNVPGSSGFQTPLGRGYVSFGSDSGHSGSATEASFALNEESLSDYLGDQLRKTRDVAVNLIQKRYGQAPTRSYAAGGSGGGREALYVADRWPELYDGVIAYYPAWSLTAMLTNYTRIAKALAAPGAWPNTAKQALLFNAVTTACDSLDGVADGLVSNVSACSFDPATLRCPGGADTGDTCLSDAQIAGASAYATGLTLPFTLANGTTTYPAFNVFSGASLVGAAGSIAPASPSTTQMAFAHYIGESFARYFIAKDASYDSLQFDIGSVGYFRQRAQYISSRQDIRPDLTQFASKGGKVLMLHGQSDAIIPTKSASDFYQRLTGNMGAPAVSSFVRYYEVPGYAHGNGAFSVSWDSLTALENWVERGTAPTGQVARDTNASSNNRTRPLCEYPTYPRYSGTGDVNVAASYTCAS